MGTRLRLPLGLLPAVLLAPPAAAQLPEARIDAVFQTFAGPDAPGCAVGVYRDGRIAFARGYGMADLQHAVPIGPASVFHVASISKQFTAMAIALLEAEGRLSLDDDVRRWLPEVPDFGRRITIRHLIHHTSGLRDQWELLSLGGWRPDDPKSQADILWLVSRQRGLNFEPGAEYLYSNTGYTLMAVIVERASGRPFRAFTEERIFRPLGMTSTHFHDDHTMIVPGRTSAYQPRPDGGWRISIPVFDNAGATSLFTTIEDLARWDRNFIDRTVGGAGVTDRMHERGRLNGGDVLPYAFALVHGEHRGLRTVGHSGADAGYRADYLRFPDEGWSFATFCNASTANAGQLNRSVAEIVLEARMSPRPTAAAAAPSAPPRPTASPAASPPAEPASWAGEYRSDELDVVWVLAVDGDGLVLRRRRFDPLLVTAQEDGALRAGAWTLVPVRATAGEIIGFRLNGGRVRGLHFDRLP
jgi:CubicO group peptidase (beta-lactamase class C family)